MERSGTATEWARGLSEDIHEIEYGLYKLRRACAFVAELSTGQPEHEDKAGIFLMLQDSIEVIEGKAESARRRLVEQGRGKA